MKNKFRPIKNLFKKAIFIYKKKGFFIFLEICFKYLISKVRKYRLRNKRLLYKNKFKKYVSDPNKITNFKIISFEKFEEPEISIIIPVYNQWKFTYNCLDSIFKNLKGIKYEIIVGDDCSNDETKNINKYIKNIFVVRGEKNQGFINNCNSCFNYAKGKYILFLNNDTQIFNTTISSLLDTIKKDEKIGAVGGKIIFPNGTLQEAGSIIWNDGSSLGYGRWDDPFKPEYSFLREVDYCSGALLLTKRNLYEKFGKFDPIYEPAYYEDMDFCMKLKDSGFKIIYQPKAQIIHYENVSKSKDKINDIVFKNRTIFYNKWESILRKHHKKFSNSLLARSNYDTKKRILFIDDMIPDPKLGSGYPRSFAILDSLVELCFSITFFPLQNSNNIKDISEFFQQKGVEILYDNTQKLNFKSFFKGRANYYDYIFVSRPHNFQQVINIIKKYNKKVKIIYDAEAIFSLREIRYFEINNKNLTTQEKDEMISNEINIAKKADVVTTVSDQEAEIYKKNGVKNIFILSHEVNLKKTKNNFEERKDILFVGGILSSDKNNPNYDAVLYFTKKILPLINKKIKCNYFIVGTNKSKEIWELNKNNIKVVGQVDDLFDYYNKCKLFIVSNRFSAGIPLKLIEASSYGIPSIVTPLIAEQLHWKDRKECLIGNTPEVFSNKVIELYTNKILWEKIRKNSFLNVNERFNHQVFLDSISRIFQDNSEKF